MATQSEEWNDNPMHKGEQTRAVKTHFKLSNLSFSLLREQQCFLPTARTGWGYVAMASWCLLLSCTVLSPPVHSFPLLSSPAVTHCPREHRLCQHFAEPTGVCVFGGEGQRGTILAHTSERWLGIFHSFMIWPLRHCHWLWYVPTYHLCQQASSWHAALPTIIKTPLCGQEK